MLKNEDKAAKDIPAVLMTNKSGASSYYAILKSAPDLYISNQRNESNVSREGNVEATASGGPAALKFGGGWASTSAKTMELESEFSSVINLNSVVKECMSCGDQAAWIDLGY